MKRSRIGPKTYELALASRIAQDARRREKVAHRKPRQSGISRKTPLKRKQGLLQRRSKPLKRVSGAATLKNRAWREFSIFIRRRDAADGYVVCVTCWIELHWKAAHAGHFVAGRGNSILFDERNCHPQCYHCNITLAGNPSAYEEFMLKRYGQNVIDELKAKRDKTVKWLPGELKSIEAHYRRTNRGEK